MELTLTLTKNPDGSTTWDGMGEGYFYVSGSIIVEFLVVVLAGDFLAMGWMIDGGSYDEDEDQYKLFCRHLTGNVWLDMPQWDDGLADKIKG